jgi:hypothetical protein
MADSRLDIGSYVMYQGEESPRVFFAHGEKITVLKVNRMWIEEGVGGGRGRRFFIVEGSDGFIHTLYCDLETEGWYYQSFARNRSKAY